MWSFSGNKCVYVKSRIDFIHPLSTNSIGKMFLKVANLSAHKKSTPNYTDTAFWIEGTPPNHPEGELGISVVCENVKGFSVFVGAKCRWKRESFNEWRNDTFEKILASYELKLDAYNAEVRKQEAAEQAAEDASNLNTPQDKILTHNSKFNAEIVKTELKRLCIEMLIAPFDFQQGRDFYGEGSDGVPNINISEDLDFYSSSVKFFEQAFDWDLLTKKFYPYYWAKRSDWKALFQNQNSMDHMFKAFLQSGMGRVMVPVREGFEDAVVYFMETGEIWNGSGIAIDTSDKLYLSLVDEATERTGVVEGLEWETVVPTSLTILQNRSVIIDEGGLPLAINSPESGLIESTNILGPVDPA